ncbi:MAG: uracil-DNA glycosylase [Planctomycetes bacterium]|nr:uracil-DNA glycosylase [Planctomycetota bacterium]
MGDRIAHCRRCPDLRGHCTAVGAAPRAAYRGQAYWSRPVPGFGDPRAWLWIVGLAPGAHGANRTGRMFTGDRSGEFLYAALHRAGIASQPTSVGRDDGLALRGAWISAAVRCAPPGNRPLPRHLDACSGWLDAEWRLLPRVRVLLCLGAIAWRAALDASARTGAAVPRPLPRFAHGAELPLPGRALLASYHVSQQNTFTGRLTAAMFDAVLARAAILAANP